MPIFILYVLVGPYLWPAQVIVVVALGALGWRSPGGAWPAALQGRSAAGVALAIAAIFTVLAAPVALMIAMRRGNREFPVSWTDGPGLVCIAQVVLLVAAAGVRGMRE